mmetsp:Transcript_29184/g.64338  ORF Transcript_29184/g.64338 Transcript_29184/m.64338 type:complete len:275 (+) Transcript_29184:90-914(+)
MSTEGSSVPTTAGGGGAGKNNRKKNKHRSRRSANKGPPKPRMTKEERRAKYTKIAHDRRDKKISAARSKNLICFRCRRKGHAAADCTTDLGDGSQAPGGDVSGSNNLLARAGRGGGKICYKCGSIEHGLAGCPKMKGAPRLPSGKFDFARIDLPHASCYLCNDMGHLASSCEKNEGRGIFVKGAIGCRVCGSVHHIASDCPENDKNKKNKGRSKDDEDANRVNVDGAAVVDDLLEDGGGDGDGDGVGVGTAGNEGGAIKPEPPKRRKKKKVVNF